MPKQITSALGKRPGSSEVLVEQSAVLWLLVPQRSAINKGSRCHLSPS